MATEQEIYELIYKYLGEDEAKKFEATLDRQKQKTDDLAASTEKASGSTANMGRTMLETGRFAQDFAQGGIGGVLNNIEGLTVALGLGSGLAGVLTVVGVGFTVLGPKLMEFAEGLFSSEEKTKNWGTSLQQIDRELKEVKKELDDYTKQQSLSNEEVDRANELGARQVELEARKAEELKKQADLKKLLERKAPTVEEAEKERAGLLQAMAGGRGAELLAAVTGAMPETPAIAARAGQIEALQRQLREVAEPARIAAEKGPLGRTFAEQAAIDRAEQLRTQLGGLTAEQQAAITRRGAAAGAMVTGAVERGELAPFQQILGLMGQRPGAFAPGMIRGFQRAAPEALAWGKAAGQELEEWEAQVAAQKEKDDKTKREKDRHKRELDAKNRQWGAEAQRELGEWQGEQEKFAREHTPEALERKAGAQKRRAEAARERGLAGQFQRAAPGMIGMQLTPEQAMEAARESIRLQQQGIPVQQANAGAMRAMATTVAKLRQDQFKLQMEFMRLQAGLQNMAGAGEPRGAPQGAMMVGP